MSAQEFSIMAEFSRLLRGAPASVDGGWRAVYKLESDFIGFCGHFPDYPLMPALMQVLMSVHMLERALGRVLKAEAVNSAKFIAQARPGDELVCLAVPRAVAGENSEFWDISITAAGSDGTKNGKNVSSFRLAFKG